MAAEAVEAVGNEIMAMPNNMMYVQRITKFTKNQKELDEIRRIILDISGTNSKRRQLHE